jgi:hypothetical protein
MSLGIPFAAIGAGIGQGIKALQDQQKQSALLKLQNAYLMDQQQRTSLARQKQLDEQGVTGLGAAIMGGMGGGGAPAAAAPDSGSLPPAPRGLGLPGASYAAPASAPSAPSPSGGAGGDLMGDFAPPGSSSSADMAGIPNVFPPGGSMDNPLAAVGTPPWASDPIKRGLVGDTTGQDAMQRFRDQIRGASASPGAAAPVTAALDTPASSDQAAPAPAAPQQTAQAGPPTMTDASPSAGVGPMPVAPNPQAIVQQIVSAAQQHGVNPGAAVKAYFPTMWNAAKAQHSEAMQQWNANRVMAHQERADARAGWTTRETSDGRLVQVGPNGQVREVQTPPGMTFGAHAGKVGQSHNVEVTDETGKIVFNGSATKTPQGWVADKDGKPIITPDGGNMRVRGVGDGGRQAATAIQSMLGSTAELVGEAKNLMSLPSTSVAGIFQGVQAVPAGDLSDALKRTFANKLTPEEYTDMTTSFQGVARALATIEAQGRATGLVGLTGLSQGLMPQSGDTIGNIFRKFATMRQIAERNTEAMKASPSISAEQKGLLDKLMKELETALPFTVEQVNQLQHGNVKSYRDVAKDLGLGGGGSPQQPGAGGAGSPPPALQGKPGLQFSPSRQQYRDDQGNVYDKNGNPVTSNAGPPI